MQKLIFLKYVSCAMKKTNEKKYRFAVDVDDVLRSLLCNMVTLYNEEFGDDLTCDEIDDYNVAKSFPKVEEKYGSAAAWFFTEHAKTLFKKSEPLDGAVEAINKLANYGDVYIVTKQAGILNKVYALEWLEECGVKYNAICFVEDKSIIRCDFLIDDYHENFRNVECSYGVIINAPYNINVSDDYLFEISNCEEIERFDSLSDFVVFFENNFLNGKVRNRK